MLMMTKEFSSYENLIIFLKTSTIHKANFELKDGKWELSFVRFDKPPIENRPTGNIYKNGKPIKPETSNLRSGY